MVRAVKSGRIGAANLTGDLPLRISPILLPIVLSAALGLFWPPPAQATQKVDLELVLAIDVSGSVDDEEARLQREGYISAFRAPEIIAAIRSGFQKRIAVTYIEWAGFDFQSNIIDWTLIHDEASAHSFASMLGKTPIQVGPYTSISGAIQYAMPLFAKNKFEAPRRVIDISGDGPNNSGRLVTLARQEAIRSGFTINGLPIINTRPSRFGRLPMPNLDLYYRKCVIGGPRAFMVIAENFKAFARAIRKKLILEIVGRVPENRKAAISGKKRRAVPASAAPAAWRFAASERKTPPCNAGELRRQSWYEDSY